MPCLTLAWSIRVVFLLIACHLGAALLAATEDPRVQLLRETLAWTEVVAIDAEQVAVQRSHLEGGGSRLEAFTHAGDVEGWQWYRDGQSVTGADTAVLDVAPGESGLYQAAARRRGQERFSDPLRLGEGLAAIDPSFVPPRMSQEASAFSVAPWQDRLVVAGSFDLVAGEPQASLLEISPTGELLPPGLAPAGRRVGRALATGADGVLYAALVIPESGNTWSVFRWHPDGTLDSTFSGGRYNHQVYWVAEDAQGRVLVAGQFTEVDGEPARFVDRRLSDGSPDPAFVSPTEITPTAQPFFQGAYIGGLDSEGRIYLAGSWLAWQGAARPGLVRLLENGSLDPTYVPSGFRSASNNYWIRAMHVDPDGTVYLADALQLIPPTVATNTNSFLVKVLPNGQADGSLRANASTLEGRQRVLLRQPAGGWVLGSSRLRRIDDTGLVEAGFGPVEFHVDDWFPQLGSLYQGTQMPDGSLAVGGRFNRIGPAVDVAPIGWFEANGTIRHTWPRTALRQTVLPQRLELAADGALAASGTFEWVGDTRPHGSALIDAMGQARLEKMGVWDPEEHRPFLLPLAGGRLLAPPASVAGSTYPQIRLFLADGREDPRTFALDASIQAIATPTGGFITVRYTSWQVVVSLVPYAYFPLFGVYDLRPGASSPSGPLLDANRDFFLRDAPAVGQTYGVWRATSNPDLRVLAIDAEGRTYLAWQHPDQSWRVRRHLAAGGVDPGFVEGVLTVPGVTRAPRAGTHNDPLRPQDGLLVRDEVTGPRGARVLLARADGGLLIGGAFTHWNGEAAGGLVALNADGTRDTGFEMGSGAAWAVAPAPGVQAATVDTIANDGQGGYWVAGSFDRWDGQPVNHFVRLGPAGELRSTDDLGLAVRPNTTTGDAYLAAERQGVVVLSLRRSEGGHDVGGLTRLRPDAAPRVLAKPFRTLRTAADDLHLAPQVVGGEGATFAWFRNGEPLAGADGPTLDLAPPVMGGLYDLQVSNAAGTVRSPIVEVVAGEAPVLVQAPVGGVFSGYAPVVLEVEATNPGGGEVSYQWYRNGLPLNGKTGPRLEFDPATLAFNQHGYGWHEVAVANAFGGWVSEPVLVTYDDLIPPNLREFYVIQSQVAEGGTIRLRVHVSRESHLQWRRDGVPVDAPWANYDEPDLTSATFDDAGLYDVVVYAGEVFVVTPGAVVSVGGRTSFAGWAYALPEGQRGAEFDPTGTGRPNLLAYAQGLAPLAAATAPALAVHLMPGDSVGLTGDLRAFVVVETIESDRVVRLARRLEVANTLGAWQSGHDALVEVDRTPLGDGRARVRWRSVAPAEASAVRFVRQVVTVE